jgi:methionyl-tRNA formyltransferase
MSYNQKFNKQLIDHCRFGIINCHAGNLPFYRGRSPLNWVLINDEKFFGITVHYVNQKIDRGDIILQKKYSINDKDDYSSIFKKAIQNCPKLLIESLKLVINKKDIPIKQTSISKKGSYFVKRKPGDEIINWNNSSRNIFCFIRGLSKPSVMAKTHLNKREIFINQSEPKFIFNKKNILPGTILTVNKNFFLVKTGDSVIKIKEWYGKVIKGLIFS